MIAERGDLTLADVLHAAQVDPANVLLIRHTYKPSDPHALRSAADLNPEKLRAYTAAQGPANKIPQDPPPLWLTFMADGKRRSRFLIAYENGGIASHDNGGRIFDLADSDALASLKDRLVIDWTADTINWAKQGSSSAAKMPVVEIADPARVPFPGFDNVLISHDELVAMTEDSRYTEWRTALAAVQGVYLIADTSDGRLYVGKADGGERLLGRWTAYARDGHGGNLALRELAGIDASHRRYFVFSILRVFGPSTPTAEVDAAEAHYKQALLTRQYGLNRN